MTAYGKRGQTPDEEDTKGEMMLEPVVNVIDVPCGQQMAFETFIEGMPDWWPLDKRAMALMSGSSAKSLSVEAKAGGRIGVVR